MDRVDVVAVVVVVAVVLTKNIVKAIEEEGDLENQLRATSHKSLQAVGHHREVFKLRKEDAKQLG